MSARRSYTTRRIGQAVFVFPQRTKFFVFVNKFSKKTFERLKPTFFSSLTGCISKIMSDLNAVLLFSAFDWRKRASALSDLCSAAKIAQVSPKRRIARLRYVPLSVCSQSTPPRKRQKFLFRLRGACSNNRRNVPRFAKEKSYKHEATLLVLYRPQKSKEDTAWWAKIHPHPIHSGTGVEPA